MRIFVIWCEWDFDFNGKGFLSYDGAVEYAIDRLNHYNCEDSFSELEKHGLIGISELEIK